MLPRPPKAVIFDMDGLLCDTEALYRDVMIATVAEMGHEMPMPLFLSLVGMPAVVGDARVQDHLGESFDIAAWRGLVSERVAAACAVGIDLKPGVIEMLDRLDALGLPRAIATSSGHPAVQAHLGPSGILPRFNAVIADGDYSRGKPNPDPYLVAAERLGVAPEFCLALEDSYNGVRAASAAGTMAVMIPDLLDATDEMRGLTVAIARDMHEVVGWLPEPDAH